MNAWLWFVISAVAAVAGVSLLMLDRGQSTSHSRERRRWAALRGWQFADIDPVLPDRWRHGALGTGSSSVARDLVTGSLFTAAGRRLVHVFDHVQGGGTLAVINAVHRRTPQPVVLELWLPTVEFPSDAGLDLLGPVGDRYAFTSDLVKARPLVTPELVALADEMGDDVPVVWIEDAWVVAAVSAGTGPSRLERLLRLLGDLADLVDGVHGDEVPAGSVDDDDPTVAGAGVAGGAAAAGAAGAAGVAGAGAAGAADAEIVDIDPDEIDPADIDVEDPDQIDPADIDPADVEPADIEPADEEPADEPDPRQDRPRSDPS